MSATGFTGWAPAAIMCLVLAAGAWAAEVQWRHLSSKTGDLPVPGESTQQTAAVVGDFAKDGVNGFIVIAPGDGTGPLKWYECTGDPTDSKSWVGHDLAGRDMIHPHSLQVADIDGDGNLDIFCAEMAKWSEGRKDPDNPAAKAYLFYGDGQGNFRKTEFAGGMGFHEARVADLDGDGKPDILNKPYNWETPRVDVWLQKPPGK